VGRKHYYEALNLFYYLWKNPPSYLNITKQELTFRDQTLEDLEKPLELPPPKDLEWGFEGEEKDNNPFKNYAPNDNNPFSTPNSSSTNSNPFNTSNSNSNYNSSYNSNQSQITVQVNTSAVKEALANIVSVEKMGIETIGELERQGRIIDNIEFAVENIHANMDKTGRLLRGIESLPAYIGNSLAKRKEKPITPKPTDRKIQIVKSVSPPMEVEILCKNVDCSFHLSILSLTEDGFKCLNVETNQLLKPQYSYLFKEIQEVIVRTRPEHMDIRFKSPKTLKDRFRLMSSYNQIIVNELYYRTSGKIKVEFEEGSTSFDYGIEKISMAPPMPRKEVEKGFFYRGNNPTFKTSTLLSEGASQEVKNQLDEVDADLTQISKILGNVYDMNAGIGKEIDIQNEKLARINKRVDQATDRIQSSNLQINTIIK